MVDLLLLLFILFTGSITILMSLRLLIYLCIHLYSLTCRFLGLILGFLAWLLETLACALYGREVVRARMELRRHLPPSPNPPSLAQ